MIQTEGISSTHLLSELCQSSGNLLWLGNTSELFEKELAAFPLLTNRLLVIQALSEIENWDSYISNGTISFVITSPEIVFEEGFKNCLHALIAAGIPVLKYNTETTRLELINIREVHHQAAPELYSTDLQNLLSSETILITGAAGSIGSELCRLICLIGNNAKLILLDVAESPLYELWRELSYLAPALELIPIVADIADRQHLARLFAKYKPTHIYHAAAGKQLPLMEGNAYHAIKVNVLGTWNLAQLAIEYEVDCFTMVSTDKAVAPSSVMGATKRVAEICLQSYNSPDSRTRFISTRFGNVLGSNGSVVPLFEQQIPQGYVTLTHSEMTRYFVSVYRACLLILNTGLLNSQNALYVFDMGKPYSILQLAKEMIHLAGKKQNEVNIQEIGIRPGEKLHESMVEANQNTVDTSITGIFKVLDNPYPKGMITGWLEYMERNIGKWSEDELLISLQEICPSLPLQTKPLKTLSLNKVIK
jgi:FlaA1/EpsC-like NDP-sugar epimerase